MLYSRLCSGWLLSGFALNRWMVIWRNLFAECVCVGKISLRIFVSISDSQDVVAMQITRLGLSHRQDMGKPL